jgi:16S rRNA (adenine1518-N6/adenine1519-N6)-dimethyltransferase
VTLLGPRETRALLDRHGLHPKTRIGQHFLIDPNTIRKVVALAGVQPGDRVIEIGPGLGALTLGLIEAGADVIAVERDRDIEPALREVVGDRARLIFQDVRAVDLGELAGEGPCAVVANLPYQIATSLVLGILEDHPQVQVQTVMVQREAGERLAAAPGSDAYGAVSVKISQLASAEVVSRISRRVFLPVPEVESVIVRIERRTAPVVDLPRARLWATIDAGFAQRRKTMRQAMRSGGWSQPEIDTALQAAGIDPTARAETLGLETFGALARALPERA